MASARLHPFLGPDRNQRDASPLVFVDNAKVFPVFGYQEFSLVATLTVTYAVPEPGTYAAAGFIALLLGGQWVARRRKR